MAEIHCAASGCKNTNQGGKVFRQCDKCHRWWCSDHGHDGKQCPGCRRGYLRR